MYQPLPTKGPIEPPPKNPNGGGSRLTRALSLLDSLKPNEIAEIYIYLAERPPQGVSAVNLALASYRGLTQDELPEFFQELKATMSSDLWEVLTDD